MPDLDKYETLFSDFAVLFKRKGATMLDAATLGIVCESIAMLIAELRKGK